MLNIIHLPERTDRMKLLQFQLKEQQIVNVKLWDGIRISNSPCTGISKAHKGVIEYAKKNNLSEVTIAEDDLCFTAKGAFNFFLKNKPKDYDIYLGSIYSGTIKDDNTIDDFSGLTLYIVNQRFYDIFLEVPENLHLDRALKNKGKYVVSNPFVVTQHNGYSDNTKQFCNYEKYLLGRRLFKNDYR